MDYPTPARFGVPRQPLAPAGPAGLGNPIPLEEDERTKAYAPGAPPGLAPPLPQVEGHELLRELGRGGMGVVYLARELCLGREVALKIVPPGLAPRQLRRFMEEASVTGQLQHPAIVPIYRVGRTAEGLDYYSMKRVQGKTLSQILKEIRLNPQEGERVLSIKRRAAIMLKVCEGVAFAHDRGVIHRDLKPGNIMLGEYGEVYVLDWGIAKALFGLAGPCPSASQASGRACHADPAGQDGPEPGEAGTDRTITGTPSYMSPEQARGEQRAVDQRSDVWSLGGILYSLLSLQPPICGADPAERLSRAAQGLVTPLADCPGGQNVPPPLQAIVERALRADRAARYGSAREMAADLRTYLDGKGSWQLAYEWEPASAPEELRRWQGCAGAWRVEPDGLYPAQRNSRGAVLLHPRRFFGDVRIELKGRILKKGDKGPGEISMLLSAPEPGLGVNETDGYCLQFGAEYFSLQKLAKNDVDMLARPLEGFQAGEPVAVAGERVGNLLRLEVNGKEQLCFHDLLPLSGSRVGLYGWFSTMRIEAIRIFTRGLDTQISCLAVPDHDFERGRFAEALAGYRRIAEELSGREEGFMARFKAGLSRMKAEDPLGAESEFQQLDGTSGEVLAQMGRAMLLAREGDSCRELMRLGAAWRVSKGTPAASFVLAQVWSRATVSLQQGNLTAAVQFLKETLRCEPPESPRRKGALAQLSQALAGLDKPGEALKVLTDLRDQNGARHLKRSFYTLMEYYTNRAEWSKAREVGEFFAGDSEALNLWPGRMMMEWLRGDQEVLRAQLERARRQLGTTDRWFLEFWSAKLALDSGRLAEAQKIIRPLFEGSRTIDWDLVLTYSWIHAMRGKPDRAVASLARHLHPADSAKRMELLFEIAELSRLRGDLQEALDCFQQILSNLPRSRAIQLGPRCNLFLGLVRLSLGHRGEALALFQSASEQDERISNQAFAGVPARAILNWQNGDPLPEPPEPGQLYPFSRRAEFFFLVGEYAREDRRSAEALRAYHRSILESPTPYRHYAWISALRIQQMGAAPPAGVPDWAPLKPSAPAP